MTRTITYYVHEGWCDGQFTVALHRGIASIATTAEGNLSAPSYVMANGTVRTEGEATQ
jgi:hypothetical protein